jgi:hypothetical protein
MKDSPQLPICVLGMGRSGSSLTARVLNLLGAELGPEESLIGSGPQNLKGYWEQRAFFDLNEMLLRALGGDYENPPLLEPGWERSPELAPLKERARELIEDHFGDRPVWAFKDPRFSLTLPFWREIVPRMRYVICVRNPAEVLDSFAAYSPGAGTEQVDWLDLWLLSTCSALVHTANSPRLIVCYEDYFSDLPAQIERLAAFIDQPVTSVAVAEIEEFAEAGLWHYRRDAREFVEDDSKPAAVRHLYAAIRSLPAAHSNDDVRRVEEFARQLLAERARKVGPAEVTAASAIRESDLAVPGIRYFGIYPDGWLERNAYVRLAPGGHADLVVRAQVLPAANQHVEVILDGRRVASRDLDPGPLELRVPVPATDQPRRVELRWRAVSAISRSDPRDAAARLEFVGVVPAAAAPRSIGSFPADLNGLEYTGIYDDGWLDKHVHVVLGGGERATLDLQAFVLPQNGQQHLEVIVNGCQVASCAVEPGAVAWRIPLQPSRSERDVELHWASTIRLKPPDLREAAALLKVLAVAPHD